MDWMRVPRNVRLAQLPGAELKVLMSLACHTPEDDDMALVPIATIAEECAMSTRNVQRCLDALEKRQVVSRTERAGEATEYRIDWDRGDMSVTPPDLTNYTPPQTLAKYWWDSWTTVHGVPPIADFGKQLGAAKRLCDLADLERLKWAVDLMLNDPDDWVQKQPRDLIWMEKNATRYARRTLPTKAMSTVARSHATLSAAVERARNGNDNCREYPDAARPALPDGDTR